MESFLLYKIEFREFEEESKDWLAAQGKKKVLALKRGIGLLLTVLFQFLWL